ncbi:SDR family oxidoreductase [Halostella sp. JP-L12]|uniref:SDR family oxidoreductase n=1 Tax=Halostella TaxID=1843185 RepID=UPI000EF80A0A|nr:MULTISPECIES: SDR family oxidoreductase [Halostella]NHN49871.1 SDR family oxidoreductase [Halostella sp. JP-L12]
MDSDSDALDGRTALITGASSGIGAATARTLAADGANVVLAARREDRLAEIADEVENEYGVRAETVPTDVTDEDQVAALVETTVEEFGSLDAVVANAGLGINESVEGMSTETYRTMMGVNVDGAFFTARETVPHLRETAGTIVFIGSFAGQYPRPGNPVYAATKWWVRGFALSLAASVGGDDIGVTVVNPTEVRTEFGSEDEEMDAFEDAFEPGEVTEPSEVADAVAFAVRQEPPTATTEIDVYRRDKFSHF